MEAKLNEVVQKGIKEKAASYEARKGHWSAADLPWRTLVVGVEFWGRGPPEAHGTF